MRKSNNFTTFANPRAWRAVLVCPHPISVSIITNYTTMAATSHVKQSWAF